MKQEKVDFKQVLKKFDDAGINRTEAAKLCHVTRQTLYNWEAGKPIANEFLFNNSCKLADYAEKAALAGLLPLDPEVSVDARYGLIQEALRKAVRGNQG